MLGRLGLVFLGGAVGTTLRAGLAEAVPTQPGTLPLATLTVNLIGAFVLGWLVVAITVGVRDARLAQRLRLGFGTGLCGGFTTFSTFMVETDQLLAHTPAVAAGYLLVSAVCGVGAALLGGWLGLRWPGTRVRRAA